MRIGRESQEGVAQQGEAAPDPLRRPEACDRNDLLQERDQEDREAQGVKHRRHHGGEPHDPAHGERGLYGEDLPRVGVRTSRLGEAGGQL